MEVPLSLRLQRARMKIRKAVNDAAAENVLSAHLMEGVLSSIMSDVRAQCASELLADLSNPIQETNNKKEGDDK